MKRLKVNGVLVESKKLKIIRIVLLQFYHQLSEIKSKYFCSLQLLIQNLFLCILLRKHIKTIAGLQFNHDFLPKHLWRMDLILMDFFFVHQEIVTSNTWIWVILKEQGSISKKYCATRFHSWSCISFNVLNKKIKLNRLLSASVHFT